jgi:hypothetical protein
MIDRKKKTSSSQTKATSATSPKKVLKPISFWPFECLRKRAWTARRLILNPAKEKHSIQQKEINLESSSLQKDSPYLVEGRDEFHWHRGLRCDSEKIVTKRNQHATEEKNW